MNRSRYWAFRVVFSARAAGLAAACFVFLYVQSVIFRQAFVLDGELFFVLRDDAMISMRHARNWVHGSGPCFNNAPLECVEGYTNFLWTAVMAIVHLLPTGENLSSVYILALNFVLGLTAVFWTQRFADERVLGGWVGAGFFLALNSQFVTWGAAGFETTLLSLMSIGTALALRRSQWALAGIFIALGLLARDDFILVLATACLTLGIQVAPAGVPATVRPLLQLLSTPLLATAAHLWFRWSYYGEVLPNTYYLKVTGWPLSTRLSHGALYVGAALPLLALGGWGAWRKLCRARAGRDGSGWTPETSTQLFVFATPFLIAAYAFWVGGDAFPGTRLLAASWPFTAIGSLQLALSFRSEKARVAVAAVVLGTLSLLGPFQWNSMLGAGSTKEMLVWLVSPPSGGAKPSSSIEAIAQRLGRQFDSGLGTRLPKPVEHVASCKRIADDARRHGMESPSVAVYYAGVLPYFCEQFVAIDLLGKSDKRIARSLTHPGRVGHNKWDYDYSLGVLLPDYFVSNVPTISSLKDPEYRRRPDGEFNWHHLLDSVGFWKRCAEWPEPDVRPLLFYCYKSHVRQREAQ